MTPTNIQPNPIASSTVTIVLPSHDLGAMMEAEAKSFALTQNKPTDYRVLSQGRAFEFDTNEPEPRALQEAITHSFITAGIKADICVQPTQAGKGEGKEGRKKSLLICDMDSTLIGQECIDELADFAGVKDYVSEITERAMRGELDFDSALKERVGLLKDLPLSNLQKCFDERIHLNKGADILAKTMSAHGARTVIVSGGFTFFTSRIVAKAGFDMHQANVLLENGDKLSGTVGMPILGRQAKKDALLAHSSDLGGPQNAISIGDGANDLAMIEASGLGIAFYAKPAVAAAAHCAINHTDLTTALFYQGYTESEFVG